MACCCDCGYGLSMRRVSRRRSRMADEADGGGKVG